MKVAAFIILSLTVSPSSPVNQTRSSANSLDLGGKSNIYLCVCAPLPDLGSGHMLQRTVPGGEWIVKDLHYHRLAPGPSPLLPEIQHI